MKSGLVYFYFIKLYSTEDYTNCALSGGGSDVSHQLPRHLFPYLGG